MISPRRTAIVLLLLCGLALPACSLWERVGSGGSKHARNVIVFIGDGMGITAYTTARVWKNGVTGKLAIDSLPYTALCSTYSYDYIVTDSAPSATSILSGVKARNDVIGEGSDAIPGTLDVAGSGHEGTPVKSILEIAAEHGLATGVVTTTTVTHATPAAAYAHIHHRDLESDIAAQLLAPHFGNPAPDIVLGGGRQFFLPATATDPEYADKRGARADGRDLTAELGKKGYRYVWNEAQFAAVVPDAGTKLLGLFEPSHMQFEMMRKDDPGKEPSLAEMTAMAIRILAKEPKGYFLMVEGGRIDHALHVNNVENAIAETVMFDDAVRTALEMTSDQDTLILVTADHSHPLTMNGYPEVVRNPDASEDVAGTRRNLMASGGKDLDGKDYPVLAFSSGPGALQPRPPIADRPALVPMKFGVHAGEDVLVAASGPGAESLHGFITNTQIFDLIRAAYAF